jgi:hypothetical protein
MKFLKLAALAGLAVLAAACGSDEAAPPDGGAPQGCADCGTALLTITDAPGDFQSYTIDVTSLELVKANGTVVQTLPETTRIDFAELVDLGEVLSAGQIPAGVYTSATLTVDYTDAEILVEDAAGGSVEVNPVDAAGAAVGEVELTVQLDARNHLTITPRRVSHLSFDLNLEASNTVDLAAGTVTVSPFIVASVVPPEERDLRIRGRLREVDLAADTYTVQVRPFHHHERSMGELVVHTTDATTYEIDGTTYTGDAGLAQLDTLADGALVVAWGSLDTGDFTFTAARVIAGTSVDDLRRDYLAGHVLARDGDTLTVGGVRLHWDRLRDGDGDADRRHGHFQRLPVTVLVGAGTKVLRAGQDNGALDHGAISVGQRIQVIGDVSRVNGGIQMDATAGLVRLNHTRIIGQVSASSSGGLTLDLHSIGGYRPERFDFSGTGTTPDQDADPDAYEVAVGAGIDTAAMPVGAYTRLFGFVAPFGLAPPDFNAATVLDYSGTRATVGVVWLPGGAATPFSAISATGLTLDPLATPAPQGAIRVGAAVIGLNTLATGLTLEPVGDDVRRAYAIAHRGSWRIQHFSDFAEFSAALDMALDADTTLVKLYASGTFDAPAVSFDARQLLVVLSD